MANETHTKKSFWKTKWGILLFIFVWPYLFIRWVWQQQWNPIIKVIVILVVIVLLSGRINYLLSQYVIPQHNATTAATMQTGSESHTTSVKAVTPTPTVISYPSYDKNLGD